eukprot:9278289-Pyramimonas_sp.AAC.1
MTRIERTTTRTTWTRTTQGQLSTISPQSKDARYGRKAFGRPVRSSSSGARPTRVANDGPKARLQGHPWEGCPPSHCGLTGVATATTRIEDD